MESEGTSVPLQAKNASSEQMNRVAQMDDNDGADLKKKQSIKSKDKWEVHPSSQNLSETRVDANSSSTLFAAPERPNRLRKTRLFKCPLCGGSFPASDIEQHASHCLEIYAPLKISSKRDNTSNTRREKRGSSSNRNSAGSEVSSKSVKKGRHATGDQDEVSKKKKKKRKSDRNSGLRSSRDNHMTYKGRESMQTTRGKFTDATDKLSHEKSPSEDTHASMSIDETKRNKNKKSSKRMRSGYEYKEPLKNSYDERLYIDKGFKHDLIGQSIGKAPKGSKKRKIDQDFSWTLEEKHPLTDIESPSIHSSSMKVLDSRKRIKADDAIQSSFPSHWIKGSKRWLPDSMHSESKQVLPASSKPYASVSDARRFLEQLREATSKQHMNHASSKYDGSDSKLLEPTLVIIRFLFLIRLTRQGKLSIPNLLSRLKGLLPPDLYQSFASFIPSFYTLDNVLPVISQHDHVSERKYSNLGRSARTDIQIIWDRQKRSVSTQESPNSDLTTKQKAAKTTARSSAFASRKHVGRKKKSSNKQQVPTKKADQSEDEIAKNTNQDEKTLNDTFKVDAKKNLISYTKVKNVLNSNFLGVKSPNSKPLAKEKTVKVLNTSPKISTETKPGSSHRKNTTFSPRVTKAMQINVQKHPTRNKNNSSIQEVSNLKETVSQRSHNLNVQHAQFNSENVGIHDKTIIPVQKQEQSNTPTKYSINKSHSYEPSSPFGTSLPKKTSFHSVQPVRAAVTNNDLKVNQNPLKYVDETVKVPSANRALPDQMHVPHQIPFHLANHYNIFNKGNQSAKANAAIIQQNQRFLHEQFLYRQQQRNLQNVAHSQNQIAKAQRQQTPTVYTIDDNSPPINPQKASPPVVNQHVPVAKVRTQVSHPTMGLSAHQKMSSNHHPVMVPIIDNQNMMFASGRHMHNPGSALPKNTQPNHNVRSNFKSNPLHPSEFIHGSNVMRVAEMNEIRKKPGVIVNTSGYGNKEDANKVYVPSKNTLEGMVHDKVTKAPTPFMSNALGSSGKESANQIINPAHNINFAKNQNTNLSNSAPKSSSNGPGKNFPSHAIHTSGSANRTVVSIPKKNGDKVAASTNNSSNVLNNNTAQNVGKPYDGLTKPAKAKNPFTHFCRVMKPAIRLELLASSNNAPIPNMKKKIQEETQFRWRALRDEEKQVFVHRSVLDFNRYEMEMRVYKDVQQKRMDMGLIPKSDLNWN